MGRRQPGDKPLSEPMLVSFLTHICVTRPQWIKHLYGFVCDQVLFYSIFSFSVGSGDLLQIFQMDRRKSVPEWRLQNMYDMSYLMFTPFEIIAEYLYILSVPGPSQWWHVEEINQILTEFLLKILLWDIVHNFSASVLVTARFWTDMSLYKPMMAWLTEVTWLTRMTSFLTTLQQYQW